MKTEREPPPLPEPDFRLTWNTGHWAYRVSKSNIEAADCYTADQIHERDAMWIARLDAAEALNAQLLGALERIAGYTLSQFMGPHDMALECVNVANAAIAAAEAKT